MSLKSEREAAADELNAQFAREGGSSSYQIEQALRAAEKRAMEQIAKVFGHKFVQNDMDEIFDQLLDEDYRS